MKKESIEIIRLNIIKKFLSKNKEYYEFFLKLSQNESDPELCEIISNKIKELKFEKQNLDENIILPTDIKNQISFFTKKSLLGKKMIFFGNPGTGKTMTAEFISKKINIELRVVNYANIISSKLGQSLNNLEFEIYKDEQKEEIVLLDEIDLLLTDRMGNDSDEMKRITTMLMQLFDSSKIKNKIIIATTNIYEKIDLALIRRFDYKFDFNNYSLFDLNKLYMSSFVGKKFHKINNQYLSERFFSNKYKNFILKYNDNPFYIVKSIERAEDFFQKNKKNDYFLLFDFFIDINNDIKEIIYFLDKENFSQNEIWSILKTRFNLSNQFIRNCLKNNEKNN